MQPNEFADLVVSTVKSAMAPTLERFARIEASIERLGSVEKSLGDLRDRVVVVETKASLPPVVPDVAGALAVALTPYAERIASLEVRPVPTETKAWDDLATAVDAATKAALSAEALKQIEEQHEALAARVEDEIKQMATLRERIAVVEGRPVPTETRVDLSAAVDAATKAALSAESVKQIEAQYAGFEARLNDATKEMAATRERLAVVEVRGQIPGPAGKDGQDGKDGADGMGFDDILIEHDGERTFTFKGRRGDRVKDLGSFKIPAMIYKGRFTEGKTYDAGDAVTYAGSLFHCHKTTVLKPDASPVNPETGRPFGDQGKNVWTLVAKRGQDGKDGKDAVSVPVVSIGGPR